MDARKERNKKNLSEKEMRRAEGEDEMCSGTFLPVKAALCSDVSPMLLDRLTSAPACRVRTHASSWLPRSLSFNCETPQPYL